MQRVPIENQIRHVQEIQQALRSPSAIRAQEGKLMTDRLATVINTLVFIEQNEAAIRRVAGGSA